jgi:hypothetical protein
LVGHIITGTSKDVLNNEELQVDWLQRNHTPVGNETNQCLAKSTYCESSSLMESAELPIGTRVKVYHSDGLWYCGCIDSHRQSLNRYIVQFDDGDRDVSIVWNFTYVKKGL